MSDYIKDLRNGKLKNAAIALDFDGVCKLFTHHKHQIMKTFLFLHLYEFQRVPFREYEKAYREINFHSEYAGKERFLCADALARRLCSMGYDCRLPGMHKAVDACIAQNLKISADNLSRYSDAGDVARAIAWSNDINAHVGKLTEIGLTPGIMKYIFSPFKDSMDFYVVTTAAEKALPSIMEKEGIDFIKRYIGQETATKSEALIALGSCGYDSVFMFGDSIEDSRAFHQAKEHTPDSVELIFVPVIPDHEEKSFQIGNEIILCCRNNEIEKARALSRGQMEAFAGNEVSV